MTCKYCGDTGYFRWQQTQNMCPCPCVGCTELAVPDHSSENNEKATPVMFIDGDISPEDTEKLIATIDAFNRETRDMQVMITKPVSEPCKLPPLEYLDTVKFNADCAIQEPESIYADEFFLSLDEVFGERGNYSEPVQAKAVSMLIAEVFRLRGYSPAAPKQSE